jgi:hypothetical protein
VAPLRRVLGWSFKRVACFEQIQRKDGDLLETCTALTELARAAVNVSFSIIPFACSGSVWDTNTVICTETGR